jgi:hypothetical protein
VVNPPRDQANPPDAPGLPGLPSTPKKSGDADPDAPMDAPVLPSQY